MPPAIRSRSRDPAQLTWLLRRFAEECGRLTAIFGDAHGLHARDLSALATIADGVRADHPLGPARLAEALCLSPSATTALLDRLERAGHLVRRPDPRDRRRVMLEMQPQALDVAAAFFAPLGVALERVMRRYTGEQMELITEFLEAAVGAATDAARCLTDEDPRTVDVLGASGSSAPAGRAPTA